MKTCFRSGFDSFKNISFINLQRKICNSHKMKDCIKRNKKIKVTNKIQQGRYTSALI